MEVAAATERILAAFESFFEIEECALHISVSIGVDCSDKATRQAHDLLQIAGGSRRTKGTQYLAVVSGEGSNTPTNLFTRLM